jgi:L-alanine-DL-glutamate epimerase-like enolase superfamily enzyme
MPALADCRVELIEQPLPADADDALARVKHPIPLRRRILPDGCRS